MPTHTHFKEYPFVILSIVDDSGDIVFKEFKNNLHLDLVMAKEIVANRMEFTQNKAHYVIVDFSNVKQVGLDAKQYLRDPEGGFKNILGAAFIGGNIVSALIANIFFKMQKDFEARYFTNKDEAIRWLVELKKKRVAQIKQ